MVSHRLTVTGLFLKTWIHLTLLVHSIAIASCLAVASSANAQSQPDENLVDNWMREAQNSAKVPKGVLHLIRFKEPIYILTKPITWEPNSKKSHHKPVTVPKGFVTDFATIPPHFWRYLPPDGIYAYAAVIHDYLYWDQRRTRMEADQIFLLAMKDFGVPWLQAQAIYRAVRLDVLGNGGGPAWRKITEAKQRGERRVLRKFPQDPRTSWHDWKKRSSVFQR